MLSQLLDGQPVAGDLSVCSLLSSAVVEHVLANLKRLMEGAGLDPNNQAALVRHTKIAPNTASKIFRGDFTAVSPKTWVKVAKGFGVTVDEFLRESPRRSGNDAAAIEINDAGADLPTTVRAIVIQILGAALAGIEAYQRTPEDARRQTPSTSRPQTKRPPRR